MLETLGRSVRRCGRALCVLFLDCDDERLERRYTETRRPHPLAGDRPIMDGIRRERQVVSALRDRADLLIDTSALTATDLKRLLDRAFCARCRRACAFSSPPLPIATASRAMPIWFSTCAFSTIRIMLTIFAALSGCDPAVAAHIETDADFTPFFDRLWRLLRPLLPRYESEGKTYLTIAIGCTGGRHRSVYVAERLARRLRDAGWRTELSHRDLPPSVAAGAPPTAFAAAG